MRKGMHHEGWRRSFTDGQYPPDGLRRRRISAHAGRGGRALGDAGRYLVFLLPVMSALISSMALFVSRAYSGWGPEDGEMVYHAMLFTGFIVAGVCFIGVGIVVGYNL